MSSVQGTNELLQSVAETTLGTLETISVIANARLSERPTSPEDALVAVNTLTSRNAIGALERLLDENRTSLRHLVHEPAIARVVALNGDGQGHTYFICRTAPADRGGEFT